MFYYSRIKKKCKRKNTIKKEEKLDGYSLLLAFLSFIAIANKGSEGNLGLKTEKAVMMKRGMFAVVREYI
ncbi:hypothetical protein [Geobacillus sp. FSL K6-3411]|jgi:hypothetical protein|uniref:hypothetical protein n=1 Tax=Geobacillus sp. FSL K6-3411 TaxID=2954614 RepID=UPI0030D8435A